MEFSTSNLIMSQAIFYSVVTIVLIIFILVKLSNILNAGQVVKLKSFLYNSVLFPFTLAFLYSAIIYFYFPSGYSPYSNPLFILLVLIFKVFAILLIFF